MAPCISRSCISNAYQFSIFNPKQAVYATTPAFNPMQAWPQMLYSSMLPTMPNATNASLATNAAAAAAAAIPRYIHTVIAALTQTLY